MGALYAGPIDGLESLARLLTKQHANLQVIVILQTAVDQRFYRRKYDAARTLTVFGATLRQEVELSQLRASLLDVVEETMQLTWVSPWLREPGKQG